jgi:hypothetical protein
MSNNLFHVMNYSSMRFHSKDSQICGKLRILIRYFIIQSYLNT